MARDDTQTKYQIAAGSHLNLPHRSQAYRGAVIYTVLSPRDTTLPPTWYLPVLPIHFTGRYIFSCRLNYDVVCELGAAGRTCNDGRYRGCINRREVYGRCFSLCRTCGRQRNRKTEKEGPSPEVLPHGLTRKGRSRPCRYCRVKFCCSSVTKSSRINIRRVILLAKRCPGVYDSRYIRETLNGEPRCKSNNKTDTLYGAVGGTSTRAV